MNTESQILAGIEATRAAIRQASAEWEPADLARVQTSLLTLEGSLPRLKSSLQEIPHAGTLPVARLRSAAKALRDEAAALEFLVDAAAAFIRSSPAGALNNPQIYNTGGMLRLDGNSQAEGFIG